MNRAYLLLGSNLNDREGLLQKASLMIAKQVGSISGQSSIYESEPWGFKASTNFLNQVLRVDTPLTPQMLLSAVAAIEHDLGRMKNSTAGYESRTMDIDILFFNQSIIEMEELKIPHPRLQERLFALIPLKELDENMIHPVNRKTIAQLIMECPDKGRVTLFDYRKHPDSLP